MISSATTRIVLAGMAKPRLALPVPAEAAAVSMPITAPAASTSGPPELRVGLQQPVQPFGVRPGLVRGGDAPAGRRDDSLTHRRAAAEPQRVADGQDLVAHRDARGVAEPDRRETGSPLTRSTAISAAGSVPITAAGWVPCPRMLGQAA